MSSETTPKNITGDRNKEVMMRPLQLITVSPLQSKCKICNKTFNTNRFSLREHMQSHHSDDYIFPPRWKGISEILSTKEQDAILHWKSFVKRPFKFENRPQCNGCNKVFSRIDAFHRHLRDSSDGCKKEHNTMVRCVQLSCGGWYVIPPDDPLANPASTTPSTSSILPPCSLNLKARMPKGTNITLSEYAVKLQPYIKPENTAKSWPKVLLTLMNDDNFPNLSSIVDDIYHALKAPPPLLKTLIECCDYYITMLPTIINFLPGDVRSFLLNFKTKDYGHQDESEEKAT